MRLRGADAVYVALARRLGMPLVTWDAEQRERAKPVVRVVTPEEA
jgi:predicted nucleic acid-binding protein